MKKIYLFAILSTSFLAWSCTEGACYYSCCLGESDCEVGCAMRTNTQDECMELAVSACVDQGLPSVKETEWKEVSTITCATCDSLGCSPSWWNELYFSIDTDSFNLPDAGSSYSPSRSSM